MSASEHEGRPNGVLEAQAVGVPILLSDCMMWFTSSSFVLKYCFVVIDGIVSSVYRNPFDMAFNIPIRIDTY